MKRRPGSIVLLISSALLLHASGALAQVTPAPTGPVRKMPSPPAGVVPGGPVTNLPAGPALPISLTVSPDKLVIGAPLAFAVGMAGSQTTPTTFKVLSELMNPFTVTFPAGRIWASSTQPTPPLLTWQYFHFCVTPDLNEQRYPCVSKDAKSATVAPFDAATVQISTLKLNGDAGTGTAVIPRGKSVVAEVRLNAILPAANITVQSSALNNFNQLIYANNIPVAATAIPVAMQLPFGGKKGTGTITAELNGKTVTRNIEIPPLKQVDKTCFFDNTPTAGSWSATVDYCTYQISPAAVTGGQTANGFVRRGFASAEQVYLEFSSSDAAIATVSPASGSIPNQQRGLTFIVKTVPTGGTSKTVTIRVLEGGVFEYLIPLTIN